ncbi:fimbrial protein [Enterobacter sp. CC120223-11]|uniref:fimbrial protein n=1 Tax=Enterobacter sp. CC120223-11 TaxID=1378073 RepID=UPI000BD12161|nr:type 1 fimbrial protein [Enterobacter sp. CC120223-11]SNY69817.1 Pilin (type 1 fimbria component protein) [Enterobacter sp. CC120223-11]
MKKTLWAAISICTVLYLPASASQNQDSAPVDGLNGVLSVNANIVETPCNLSIEMLNQDAMLASVSLREFRKVGDISQPAEIKFIFDDCMPGTLLRNAHQDGALDYINDQPSVYVQLDSEHDIADKALFRLHGDVAGVGLRIEGPEAVRLIPGVKSKVFNLNPGRNEFILTSFLEKTSAGPVRLGAFWSRINVAVEYH